VTTFAGEDRNPVFASDEKSFYYLSEESGSFNVHRMPLEGGRSQQLTSFKQVPVRFLSSSDNGTLCFGFDGQIYTMTSGASPKQVDVAITSDTRANAERIMAVNNGAGELTVSPNGKEVAFTYRGDVFVAGVDGGGTKRITNTPEVERGLEFSPDGKALIYASERGGKWAIYEARRQRAAEPYFYASTVVVEAPVVSNDHQNSSPKYSPDGSAVAYLEDRNTLKTYTVANKQSRTLLTDKELFGNDHYYQWSPDGKWILFDLDVPGIAPGEVGLVRADGSGKVVNLTESGFNDARGKWILDGKAMLWFSNRDGLKSVAQGGSAQQDVYAMFFDRDAWEKSRLSKDEFALAKEIDSLASRPPRPDTSRVAGDSGRVMQAGAAGAAGARKKDLVLDLDGIENRKARLTIHSSSLSDALVSKDGEMLFYLARFERGINLWSTNLRTRETKMVLALNANSGGMVWDKNQKAIFLLADGQISRIDPATAKRDNIALAGEEALDADAERAAMFDHVWRRTRDTFYSKGYHGIDWIGLRSVYAKYLPHVGNNYEFAEMMAEMLGELNISHSGATFNASQPTDDATASLGIFYDQTYAGPGVKITEVIKDGPLDRSTVAVKPGMIIESIDGRPIPADKDVAEFLNRKAGKNVLLGFADGAAKSEAVVKPITLGEENRLLYTRWVKRNQDEVDKASNGELGYVHIPG
jgi:Tol biopolymer transport system component